MPSNANPSSVWIPLHAIYLRQGINIGGFMYRQYHTDSTWELHLHTGGAVISLLNKSLGQTFYISTSNVDSCDGLPDETAVSATRPGLSPELASQAGMNNALVCNQVRREITAEPLVTIDGPTDLGEDAPQSANPASTLTDEQRRAKAAYFKPANQKPAAPSPAPSTSPSPNGFKSLQVPKPAKRKVGRPRKVPLDAPVSDVASVSNTPVA